MLGKSMGKNSLLLFAFAILTALLLAGTYQLTYAPIKLAEEKAAARALYEIVPASTIDNDLLSDTLLVEGIDVPIHLARKDGQVIAAIFPTVTPEGYSGDIKLLVGVHRDGTVAGVRTLVHSETPGLGDKIELAKSDWILSFNGRSLTNPEPDGWTVKKNGGDFDSFTGATITPRAVVNQVQDALEKITQQQDTIFGQSDGSKQ